MAYAIQDHAFKRWLKFGGAATMLVASAVDVLVQVCPPRMRRTRLPTLTLCCAWPRVLCVQIAATALSCVVFSIASQRFEHSSGYALFDQDNSSSVMVPFARHGSWSGDPTSAR